MCKSDEIFNKTFTEFENRRGAVAFLLNIILNLQEVGIRQLCECQNITDKYDFFFFFFFYKKCKTNPFFIYENSLKFGFLEKFTQKLYMGLYNLRQKNAHMICCLIKKKNYYEHRDWFDGSTRQYNTAQALEICEKYKINYVNIFFF